MQFEPNDGRYQELAEKWLNGTITPTEEKEFANWYNNNTDESLRVPAELAMSEEAHRKRILENIMRHRSGGLGSIPMRKRWAARIAAAAVVLILSGTGVYISLQKASSPGIASTPSKRLHNDLVPGGEKAVLTLANGSKIILDSAANGTLTQQGNTKIIKLIDGQLAYREAGTPPSGKSGTEYNTISTPRGGQYQIVLADGSKVWLNSSSSIKFPTAFLENKRDVGLTGEGYFEIAHDAARPFEVSVNGAKVQVLGTHFNINSYTDEDSIKTTLLEGSVRVSRPSQMEELRAVKLKPGQQAIVPQVRDHHSVMEPDSEIKVVNVDADEVVAWKNGEFQFEGADIKTVMRQVARWYDVEVVYQGDVKQHFRGTIPRNVEASKVFGMLELTKAVHFEINGKKVIVRP